MSMLRNRAARRPGTAGAARVSGFTSAQLAAMAVAVVAGLAIWVVGLPSTPVFGTPLSDLTVPAALFVALAGITGVAAAAAHSPWRVVDIVVAGVLGVAGGLLFALYNTGTVGLRQAVVPPASALLVGVWLLPAVVGGLVIRRPGAAVLTESVAAVVSALIGNEWGFATVWYGLVEGLGAEVVFALLLYRWFGLVPALLAGAGAGVAVGLLDTFVYYPTLSPAAKLGYVALSVVSGAVVAGAGGWALTRGLARTGALSALPSGRSARRV